MDPNETLNELRAMAIIMIGSGNDTIGMADLFEALDLWLSRGGFLPRAWDSNRAAIRNEAS